MLFIFSLMFNVALAKDILVVGDSLTCGPMGGAVVKGLSSNPQDTVTVYCAVGARPSDWLNGTLPVRTRDKETHAPTSYYNCHTCSGDACKAWYTAKIPDEEAFGQGTSCNGATAGAGPKLSEILGKKPPYDKVVVGLGTNGLEDSAAADETYKQTFTAIKSSGVKSCAWIGPPHFDPDKNIRRSRPMENNLNGFYDSLDSVTKAGNCKLIDSRDATYSPAPGDTLADGVHRRKSSGDFWAEQILPQISGTISGTPNAGPSPAAK